MDITFSALNNDGRQIAARRNAVVYRPVHWRMTANPLCRNNAAQTSILSSRWSPSANLLLVIGASVAVVSPRRREAWRDQDASDLTSPPLIWPGPTSPIQPRAPQWPRNVKPGAGPYLGPDTSKVSIAIHSDRLTSATTVHTRRFAWLRGLAASMQVLVVVGGGLDHTLPPAAPKTAVGSLRFNGLWTGLSHSR